MRTSKRSEKAADLLLPAEISVMSEQSRHQSGGRSDLGCQRSSRRAGTHAGAGCTKGLHPAQRGRGNRPRTVRSKVIGYSWVISSSFPKKRVEKNTRFVGNRMDVGALYPETGQRVEQITGNDEKAPNESISEPHVCFAECWIKSRKRDRFSTAVRKKQV